MVYFFIIFVPVLTFTTFIMSKAEQTRQFIIEKSAPVFNIKGYAGTSLSDIQEVSKLTKGAIYGNFSDKNELAVAAYEYSSSMVINALAARMQTEVSASDALLAYADYYVQNVQFVLSKGGCPLMNAAIEADDHLFFMKDAVRNSMKRILTLIQHTIEHGQTNGEFNPVLDATEYAATIFSLMEGTILLVKTMNDGTYFRITADRIKLLIDREVSI